MSPSDAAAPATIGTAREADLPDLARALRSLAEELGDAFLATETAIGAALFGPRAFAVGLIARAGAATVGAALTQPVLSTRMGTAGVYVSDIWIDRGHRGRALGRRLLAEAARDGARRWGAGFVKLSVYADNPGAMAFYRRIGFAIEERDRSAILAGAALTTLTEGPTP